jgi:hypothetical protein
VQEAEDKEEAHDDENQRRDRDERVQRQTHRATFGRPISLCCSGVGKAATFASEPPSSLRLI